MTSDDTIEVISKFPNSHSNIADDDMPEPIYYIEEVEGNNCTAVIVSMPDLANVDEFVNEIGANQSSPDQDGPDIIYLDYL